MHVSLAQLITTHGRAVKAEFRAVCEFDCQGSVSNGTSLSKVLSSITQMINACRCFKRLSVCIQEPITEDLEYAEFECRVGRGQEMARR